MKASEYRRSRSSKRPSRLSLEKTRDEMTHEEKLQEAAMTLTGNPSPDLLAIIEQLALWIEQSRLQEDSSPPPSTFRKQLMKEADAADILAAGLEQDSRAALGPFPIGGQIKRGSILSQWACREGMSLTARGMRGYAQGLRAAAILMSDARGRSNVNYALGRPTSRLLCAMAAFKLFESVCGGAPGRTNEMAQKLCTYIWDLAGGPPMKGQKGTDNSDSGWARHLKNANKENKAPVSECREVIETVLASNGFGAKHCHPVPLKLIKVRGRRQSHEIGPGH